MTKSPKLSVPPKFRRGAQITDEWTIVDGGRDLLDYLAEALGFDSLANLQILDMGCGTKFTQAIVNYDIPIGKYVGVDIYRDMIDYLVQNTAGDPRFEYHYANLHNAMYNPSGERLSAETRLPLVESSFDVICLFSVFTHLEPHDYADMLRLMRRYAKDDGKLMYTLYLDERTFNGYGLIEAFALKLDKQYKPSGVRFRDAHPETLKWAVYSREYALELMKDTGWEIDEVRLPNQWAQHQFICRAT